MAKIQPLATAASRSPSDDQRSQQTYTVWMKSLVFNGNGCTVYGPDGAVAFRVDNYGCRGGREVFFMDRAGNALIRIRRKGFGAFRRWEVCRCAHNGGQEEEEATPWFTVRRAEKGGAAVAMHGGAGTCYKIDGCSARKSEYRIRGADGAVVAEVARKQTPAGVVLGEDVLTLTVAPEADHLLLLGLIVVRGLINRSL
ncbi:protein LURP-one-related 11-like [Hordeum vulgare subsp. vulgare]|uniref:Protein LURP-one-related 11 n=1 Tax=Hordeum vulgare subsp. vulgare TaxID=112509 RepID=A0A8I6Y627_HORVV|nr:protein LURP-one-related 11-like [Hordeum vulgare subsp. vulgare]